MSDTRVKCHPTLGILVCTDGHVMVPRSGTQKAHWTSGTKNGRGYRQVRIAGKTYLCHRLVVEAFIQYPIPKGMEVDHISRDKSSNMLSNLRIVSKSGNRRNRADHDLVEEQGRTHWYEDAKKANRERQSQYYAENKDKARKYKARYYAENREKELEYQAQYRAKNKEKLREQRIQHYQDKRKTHRVVHFANGKKRWIPIAEAEALLAIPLNQRIFSK